MRGDERAWSYRCKHQEVAWVGGCRVHLFSICFFSMFSATRAFEGYLGPTVSSGVAAYCEARWWRGASGTVCLTRADMTCDETMAGHDTIVYSHFVLRLFNRQYSLGAACRAIPAGLPVPWLQ